MHLDIDRFRAVNETLGHEAGDLLLSQVADRLRWSTRVEDTAVRLGADEFLVVAEDVEDLEGLRALADRLLGVLDEPFVVNEREINLSASVGLTLGSDMTPDDLLRQAQSALTKAKADGSRARIEVYEGALTHGESTPCSWRPSCGTRSTTTSSGSSTSRSCTWPTSRCWATRR